MKSLLLLRDRHLGQARDTEAGAESRVSLRLLPESLQLTLSPVYGHLIIPVMYGFHYATA